MASDRSLGTATRTRPLLLATIGLIVLYIILDAIVQSLPPHYSPIRQAESDLGVGPYGFVMAANFINRGILTIVFLVGLSSALKPRQGGRVGYLLLGLWGVGSLVLAAFPTDVSPPATVHGVIHLVVAFIAFLGGGLGAVVLSRELEKGAATAKVGRNAEVIAALAVAFLIVLVVGPAGVPRAFAQVYGLVERIFIGLVLGWTAFVSFALLREPKAAVD